MDMATDKKSFLLYCDLIHTVSKMPNDKAGELFKHILDYVNDHGPETDDLIIQLTFEPIKQQLKRDLKKWESIADRNKINGSKGGRPKNPTEPKKPIGLFGNPTEPKKPVSVNVNVTDTVTDNVNVKEINKIPEYEEFKNYALEKEPYINIKELSLKYEAWKVNDWKNGNNKKIVNWKSSLLNSIPYIGTTQKKELINDKWDKLRQEQAQKDERDKY